MMPPLLLLWSLLTAPASALTLKLDYRQDIEPADTLRDAPSILVEDARPANHGRGEFDRLGNVRAGAGFPYPVKTGSTTFDTFVSRWIADCLAAAGWRSGGGGGAGTTLVAVVEDMWIEGYMHYEMRFVLRVDVVRAGKVLWTWRMDESSGEFLDWTVNELNKPLNAILAENTPELVAGFESAAFAKALGGSSSRASTAPAATVGCSKDTDCKGDRVCEDGRCVSP